MTPKSANESTLQDGVFRERLLAWYDANARDLPWRRDKDPYRVWVSEIMLQQTRVAAVIDHYHKFLRRFPTVQKLAAAREPSVLTAWSGLGYYRRARMLHAAAKVVAREFGGRFPRMSQEWLDLPGIGRYTAAAIASIAFGEAVAVVDGNVERVVQRVSGKVLAGEQFWQVANSLLDRNRPGDFNQAMMELGATVCTPRAPACLSCPVMQGCVARGELKTGDAGPGQQKREIHLGLYRRAGEVLLVQRPAHARLMPGMWELPETDVPRCTTKRVLGSTRTANQSSSSASPIFTVRHSITVTNYTVHVRECELPDGKGKWVAWGRLSRMPLTGLARKILRKAGVRRAKN